MQEFIPKSLSPPDVFVIINPAPRACTMAYREGGKNICPGRQQQRGAKMISEIQADLSHCYLWLYYNHN
jgi:hypothetical protein